MRIHIKLYILNLEATEKRSGNSQNYQCTTFCLFPTPFSQLTLYHSRWLYLLVFWACNFSDFPVSSPGEGLHHVFLPNAPQRLAQPYTHCSAPETDLRASPTEMNNQEFCRTTKKFKFHRDILFYHISLSIFFWALWLQISSDLIFEPSTSSALNHSLKFTVSWSSCGPGPQILPSLPWIIWVLF